MRFFRWIGHSGVIEMIAEQFGFAMMPWCVAIFSGLISGTTSGTVGSIRISRRVIDDDRAGVERGLRELLRSRAAGREQSDLHAGEALSVSSFTGTALPRNSSDLPAERADANSRSSDSGNLRCSRQRISSTPTAPVAPTMATTGFESFLAAIERFSINEKAPSVSGEASLACYAVRVESARVHRERLALASFFSGAFARRAVHGAHLSRVERENKAAAADSLHPKARLAHPMAAGIATP